MSVYIRECLYEETEIRDGNITYVENLDRKYIRHIFFREKVHGVSTNAIATYSPRFLT